MSNDIDLFSKITAATQWKTENAVETGKSLEEINEILFQSDSKEEYIKHSKASNIKESEGESYHPNLSKKLAKKFAIIYIQEIGDNCLIHAHCSKANEPLEVEEDFSKQAKLLKNWSIPKQMEKNLPIKIRGNIKRLSDFSIMRQLTQWLHNQETVSQIIINDRSALEIPWEMIEMASKPPMRAIPIGAKFSTTRWQDIPDKFNFEHICEVPSLSSQSVQCVGDIVSFAVEDISHIHKETQMLSRYHHHQFNDFDDFLMHLRGFEQGKNNLIGLLFIASHGFYGKNIEDIQFGASKDESITYSELEGSWDFGCFHTKPTVIFMNACHSGRFATYDDINEEELQIKIGFPTFFIKQGIRGVVGTMGEVKVEYAPLIASNFFDELKKNEALTIPEILRNLREKSFNNLFETPQNKEEKDKNLHLYLSTFMYTYYGHPLTVLKLSSPVIDRKG